MAAHEIIDIDLFISHASEDKEILVRPLATFLRNLGARVWYDEFMLSIGDSLSRSIDKGLATAKYGIVVISRHFMAKNWTEYELRGLTTREVGADDKIILPIWHGVSKSEVAAYSPTLADKIAIDTHGKTIEEIAEALIKVIRPDLAEHASLLRYLVRDRGEDRSFLVPTENLHKAPLPVEFVTEGQVIVRALNVVNILSDASSRMVGSFSEFLSDLARDIHPEIELRVWEVVAAVYSYVNQQFTLSSTEKSLLVRLIVICSIKGRLDARREAGEGLDPSAIDTAIERWDYLTELSQSGHVRFATESINEDASGGEVINGGSDAH